MSAIEQLDELQGFIRVEEQLQPVVALLRQDFDLVPALRNAVPYTDENGQPTGLTNVEVNYLLKHLPPLSDALPEELFESNSTLFTRVEELWLEHGFEIITRTVDQPFRVLRVANPRDGFIISLKQGKVGNLWMTSSSAPVVQTDVTPPSPVWG